MDGTGLAGQGQRNRLFHHRAHSPVGQAEATLDDGAHHGLMIEHLVGIGLGLGGIDAAGQKDQRHAVLHGVRHDVDRVRHAGPEGRHKDRQATRAVPQALGEKAARVFMTHKREFDPRVVQTLHQAQHFTPGDAERMGCARTGQGGADDIRAGACVCSHSFSPIMPSLASCPRSVSLRFKMDFSVSAVSCARTGGAL